MLQGLRVEVELSWSPGHANIKGNELADQQAKEAAQEAKDAEDLQAVSSFGDVNWQQKNPVTESGRADGRLQTEVETFIHSDLMWDI